MSNQGIGDRIRRERRKQGISQTELADCASISRNYVSLIERGKATNVSIGVIGRLAAALKTTTAALLGYDRSASLMVPESLSQLGIEEGLNYRVVEKLARLPRDGKEPRTVEEWRELYKAIRPFIEDSD